MALPFFPITTRFFLILAFRTLAADTLSECELDRDRHRTVILALAGFSFTATIALFVLHSSTKLELGLPIYHVLLSFSVSLMAMNVQSYKSSRWHDQLATALNEVATLSLALALASMIFYNPFSASLRNALLVIASLPWFLDHIIRLVVQARYLHQLAANRVPSKEVTKNA